MGKLNGTNPNHPKKGSRITVEPIRSDKNIKRVKRLLKDNTRDLLLFTMGINNGLRISDLLKLKVGDVIHIRGRSTEFSQEVTSMEIENHKVSAVAWGRGGPPGAQARA